MMCETEDAGKLRHAAQLKNDEKILLQIRGQDCVAIEVRYHRACYMNYTNFLACPEKSQSSIPLLYEKGYKKFCSDVIEKKIITERKIMHITWMDLPPAPDAVLENVKCGCSKGCTSRPT